ncbi:MAG: hypothetical protein Q9195_000413 [Heterodermia aff. obscurata]
MSRAAILSVKIKNGGVSGYQQDVYGDSIVVERHFSRSGGSTFKLKSSSGKIISTRKADLDEICDYYALQIDNPMNVLTQDMARQFLNSSTASDKYKFFMRGTQLEHLDGDYQQMEQSIDQLDTELVTVDQDVKHYQKEAESKKALLALSEKRDSVRRKIRTLSNQMAWAQVEEQERLLDSYRKDLHKAEEAVEDAERKQSEAADAYDGYNHAYESAATAIEDAQNDLAPLNEEKDIAKEAFDQCKREALALQTEQRAIREYMKAADARISKAKTDIQEENRRLGDLDGGNHARRLAEIEAKKADAVSAKGRFQDHERSLAALEEAKRIAEKLHEDSQGPVAHKKAEVRNCDERLQGLIRDRGQQQGAYPASMPRLLRAIEQDGAFRQAPVGPIGKHVRLLNPVWSSILEKSFGGVLNSFVVTSKEDQNRLSNVMQQVGCSCPIIIGNNSPISTLGHEPDPNFETTLRVLEVSVGRISDLSPNLEQIDNDLVRRHLIIGHAIEQTILIKSRPEAVEKLNAGRLPNVKQCFTLLENKRGAGIRLNYGYGGNLGQNFVPAFEGTPRMKTDIEYQINSQRELLQGLKSELGELDRQTREKQNDVKKATAAIVMHGKQSKTLRTAMQQAEDIVEKLQDALESDAIEEGRLDALKEHLAEAEEEKAAHVGSFEESVIACDKAKDLLRTKKEEMSEIDHRIEGATTKLKKVEARAAKAEGQRGMALQQKNAAIKFAEKVKDALADMEAERDEKAGLVTHFIEQASLICARVAVDAGESGSSIDKKLAKLEADVKRFENQMGGSQQKITEDAAKAVEAAEQAELQASSMRDLAQHLKMTLMNRRERWQLFQRAITARARVLFGLLLSERRFRGKLLIDHKGKSLDLSVEPDETRKRNDGRAAKTLSGGEKSFSTTCLLLSLWEAMGSPVRCLDEFDVFMDVANREVSIDLIISAARASASRQFIFITPQSMSSVSEASDVKIHKMTDPKRGQKTLPFVAA